MAKYQPQVELLSLPNNSYRLKITLHGVQAYNLKTLEIYSRRKKGRKIIPPVIEFWLTPAEGETRPFELLIPWEKGDDTQIGLRVMEMLEEEALDTIINIPLPSPNNGNGPKIKIEGQMKERKSPERDISVIRFTDSLDDQ